MGSAAIQGELWGARAEDWAEFTESGQVPFYEAVFDRVGVGPSVRLLDAGCGAGLALVLAAKRGATVSGLDASAGLLEVARHRLPDADLRQGDLEALPFDDGSFDVVTAFNAVQYAENPQRALRELARVAAPAAPIVVVTWGPAERCEMRDVLGAIGGLLPPPPPDAGGPFALSTPGALEALVESAGLTADSAFDVPTPYEYPDVPTAVRAQMASGPAIRAVRHAGEQAVETALVNVMTTYERPTGAVRLDNEFKALIARN